MSSPAQWLELLRANEQREEDDRASPEHSQPTGNRYDQMFGDDSENDEKLSVHESSGLDSADDSDIQNRKRKRTNADHEDDDGEEEHGDEDESKEDEHLAGLDDELFGDEIADDKRQQILDEDDLDSSRHVTPEEPVLKRQADISLGKYTVLDPGEEGDLYLMKIPQYLQIIPELFDADTFTIPKPSSSQPSPYTLATTAIRFRQHPTQPDTYQSNSRIIRWSDGSLSLQIGSSPELYDLPSKPLAPARKLTRYDPNQDSHTYLVTPHEGANMLRFIGHATQSLSVMPAGDHISDEAMARLHEQLSAAVSKGGIRVKSMELQTMEDPEKLKREAEKAEKERVRAQKRLEAQRRKHDILPDRGGLSGSRRDVSDRGTTGGRLSAAEVEDRKRERRAGRGSPGRTGASREDDYDRGDDFLADEDDEEDDFVVNDEDEDEDMGDGDEEEEAERRARAKLKKAKDKSRNRNKQPKPREGDMDDEEEEEEEEEAEFTEESEEDRREKRKKTSSARVAHVKEEEGDEDGDEAEEVRAGGGGGRKRRRFVVDDDDDEE